MLHVSNLSKTYRSGLFASRQVPAAENISFCVANNEIFGLVGASGCGKTAIGDMIVRLLKPSSGSIHVDGRDITALRGSALRAYWPRLQMIFQDPRSSLNPRMRVGQSLLEGLRLAGRVGKDPWHTAKELADQVSVRPEILERYPHEISGGEIQRIVIARALSLEPAILVADEPTSNLDMSVQAQVLRLLKEVQQRLQIPCILISHDMDVVRRMCQRVAIISQGRIVETGPTEDVVTRPQHPCTQQLVAANALYR